MHSRGIQELCCIVRAALFNICLDDSDVESLGFREDGDDCSVYSPAVSSRARLNRACLRQHSWAQKVADRLDLQYMETVMCIQRMDEEQAGDTVDRWLERPRGEALPGLVWALCSDPRPEVYATGVRLCHEVVTLAFRGVVDGAFPASSKKVQS